MKIVLAVCAVIITIVLSIYLLKTQPGSVDLQKSIYLDQVRRSIIKECQKLYTDGLEVQAEGAKFGVNSVALDTYMDPNFNFMDWCVNSTLRARGYISE